MKAELKNPVGSKEKIWVCEQHFKSEVKKSQFFSK
jgi:hypothetical protein